MDQPPLPGISIAMRHSANESDSWPTAVPVWVGWYNASKGAGVVWQLVTSWDDYEEQLVRHERECCGVAEVIEQYFLNGGTQGYMMLLPKCSEDGEHADWLATQLGKESTWNNALYEDYVNLITLPLLYECLESTQQEVTSRLNGITPTRIAKDVADDYVRIWKAVLSATAARPDWFFVLDMPVDLVAANACIEQLRHGNGLGARGQHAALYGPYLVLEDNRLAAPSGAVCGLMARVDAAEGIWKAPANEVVVGALRPLYPENLLRSWRKIDGVEANLICNFAGRGVRVWGCRTLSMDHHSPYRYVQVRRATTWIEYHLRAICRFAVFEPNQLLTWLRVRTACEAWLRRLWEAGGLMGGDEAHAFLVQVGLNETMTAADVIAGYIRIKIGIALLHPAEFVEVHMALIQGESVATAIGASGSEFKMGAS